MRSAIREIPNGTHRHRTWSDGFEEPILIEAAVTIEDEGHLHRFRRFLPPERTWHQRGLQLHPRLRLLRHEGGHQPRRPPQRRGVPPGARLGAARIDPQLHRSGAGRLPTPDRPFPAGSGVRGAGRGDARPADGARRRPDLDNHMEGGRRGLRTMLSPFSLFQCGGAGARAAKDGLSATGFPSGVAGVPAESVETLTPMVQHRRGAAHRLRRSGQVPGRAGPVDGDELPHRPALDPVRHDRPDSTPRRGLAGRKARPGGGAVDRRGPGGGTETAAGARPGQPGASRPAGRRRLRRPLRP